MRRIILAAIITAFGCGIGLLLSGTAAADVQSFYGCGSPQTFCPGLVQAWGVGTITSPFCDPSQSCVVTATGTIQAKTLFGVGAEMGQASFVLTETIDFAHPSRNGTGGKCYPGGGQISLQPAKGPAGTMLVIDFQGSACESGTETFSYLFNGPWTVDNASRGAFGGSLGLAQGIGSMNIFTALITNSLGLSFTGNLNANPSP